MSVGGYDGWWNATPASGDMTGLPAETVTVDTNTGEIIDAFNWAKNDPRGRRGPYQTSTSTLFPIRPGRATQSWSSIPQPET